MRSAQGQDVSLLLDTGSGLAWTQCKPCTKHCFKQRGDDAGCISSKCAYYIDYVDSAYTNGLWSTEKLTLTNGANTLVIDGYNLGCGFNNSAAAGDDQGLEGASGILGLDRSTLSFISQMPASFNKHFSYCLSSSGSSPGYITFGKTAEDIKDFPLVLGNVQQRGIDVHYDVANGRLGFAPGSCS
ncbi:hypothetical protein Patl1_12635 [Pistacia atlantica]|uniref:Uncharacterized protein n=1 Tax=Pistacia atlantica TaxID=434234 RepID=A0ACC1AY78_9ROSI|nr:hypothetical protein Patl1_12635 [Pistacia atlantica]